MAIYRNDEKRFKRDFDYLIKASRENNNLSERYIFLAKRILTSKKIKLPKEEKFLI